MKKALTLIELVAVISIIGIIAIIAVPNMGKSQMVAKESAAQANLRIIAAAIENYGTVNNGLYPTAQSDLTGATPPFLNQSYCGNSTGGYTFNCTLNTDSYILTAAPVTCGMTGAKTYTITTGAVMTANNC